MKLTPFLRRGLLAAVLGSAAVFATTASQAALITWGAPTPINPAGGAASDLDVSTAGTLVGAVNLGNTGVGNTIINGVTFTGLALTGNNVTSGNFNLTIATSFAASNGFTSAAAPFSSLSAPYRALLSSGGGDFANPITLTMSGLSIGQTYQFEWWSSRTTGFFASAAQNETTATAGNSVTLNDNPSLTNGALGQFALGTFTADATSQVITFSAASISTINGFQLRQLAAVPEPGTALAGVALLGLCGMRRRR